MDRETARQEIRRRVSAQPYLTKSKSGLYICPFCGSGTGKNQSGALKYYPDTNTVACFANCAVESGEKGKSYDVIDLYMNHTGADYNTALSLLAQEIGITIDQYRPTASADFSRAVKKDPVERPTIDFNGQGNTNTTPTTKTAQEGAESPVEATADYTAYYRECRKHITDPAAVSYLSARGISTDTAAAYWLGYDPAADPANNPGGNGQPLHPCPRLIIPTSAGHYIGRRIDGQPNFAKMNPKGSTPGIFNAGVLYAQDVQEIFVTEGAFDALSILEVGAAAIAINSASNADALLKQLEERPTAATLILCLDKDTAGAGAAQRLKDGLNRLNISHITADICGSSKDPNEALTANRPQFIEAVQNAQRQTAAKPDNTAYYIDQLMTADIERFKTDIKTGYPNLDKQCGGLYPGLYCLAAISSLGKTTFAAQLADQLAAAGQDVLFFSLEQSRLELVSKSLARMTAQKDKNTAVTSLAIRKGYLPPQVLEAAEEYKKAVADRMSVIECNFSFTVSEMGEYIRRYIRRTGTRPVIFVDYVQILQGEPQNGRQSTKETVDNTVTELKRISRAEGLTVFIISSVNRSNYLTPIDFESLKESGSLEYTADVVWGLQLQCLNDPLFDKGKDTAIKEKREKVKAAKAENPRKIELCCLKNRYGIANFSCFFNYYPANDLFEPGNDAAADFSGVPKAWEIKRG